VVHRVCTSPERQKEGPPKGPHGAGEPYGLPASDTTLERLKFLRGAETSLVDADVQNRLN